MAATATVMAIGSTLLSAYGTYQQGAYQKGMGEYQAKVAERDAQSTLEAGASQEASFRKKARAQRGSNIVNIAKSGVAMKGSPLLVMTEIARETEDEAYNIRRNAQVTADNYRSQAGAYRLAGSYAYKQGLIGAGATLMQGGSNAYKQGKIDKVW